ncbi:MAG: hypothetical protein IJE46_00315 [Clostridia bacterium]|nr:hypothetical protein [Clostridia bacterium]
MDIGQITDMVMNQGIWCALFCYLFYSVRKESKDDKNQLMELLNIQTEKLADITTALENLSNIIKGS